MKRFAIKTSVVVVATGLAAMIAGGVANAAPSTTAPSGAQAGGIHPNQVQDANHNSYVVQNNTPYVMTLTNMQYNGGPKWNTVTGTPPPAVIEPGQTSSWINVAAGGVPLSSDTSHVEYQFTDIHGGLHVLKVSTPDNYFTTGWENNVHVWASDILPGGAQRASTEFNYSTAAEAPFKVSATLLKPDELTVDAAKDPKTAAAIMAELPHAKSSSFTPNGQGIAFSQSDLEQATGLITNLSSGEARVKLTSATTNTQSNSLARP